MTTYKSYAEAKIAHPDSEIVTTTKLHSKGPEFEFLPVKFIEGYYRSQCDSKVPNVEDGIWVICNPADYCSTVEEFLSAGFRLVRGDWVIRLGGVADNVRLPSAMNCSDFNDDKRYILSAAALNGGCKIPEWTVYNNTMPLCELTDEKVGKLVKHSGCVEHMNPNSGEWGATITPMWNRAGIYRIKPKSERDLFIEAAVSTFDGRTGLSEQAMSLAAQTMFDSGKFKRVIKDGE